MKNFIQTSTKCYNKTTSKTFSEQGFLINEIASETYTESETKPIRFSEPISNSKWYQLFSKSLNFILKAEGLISFCCYLKEPAFINFLILTAIGIGKILMFN